eukprot:gene35905-43552_t
MAALLVLDKPEHAFHGDHWYHVAEYYLSAQTHFDDIHRKYITSSTKPELFIVSSSWSFFPIVTRFTFFLLLLAVDPRRFSRVSLVYSHSSSHPSIKQLNKTVEFQARTEKLWYEGGYIYPALPQATSRNLPEYYSAPVSPPPQNPPSILPFRKCKGRVVGSMGLYPAPIELWIPQKHILMNQLHERGKFLCPTPSSPASQETNITSYNMLVYQRDQNRRIVNLDDVLEYVRSSLQSSSGNYDKHLSFNDSITAYPNDDHANKMPAYNRTSSYSFVVPVSERVQWHIHVLVHGDVNTHPCEVFHRFQTADVLLSTHGFQMTGLLFLPPTTHIVEYFPFMYLRFTYALLARSLHLQYTYAQAQKEQVLSQVAARLASVSLEDCMDEIKCRSFAREQDALMSKDCVDKTVAVMRKLSMRNATEQ